MLKVLLAFNLLLSVSVSAQKFDSTSYYRKQRDTARHKLYMANQQINAVNFYIKVVNRNPANKVFFWNWITTRAMVKPPEMRTTPLKK